ncbi:uncharacterized protein [Aegilops tauschii subsp. strangulata]|uniref:uncharacterized protein n=1 Tax=Aegilops tauschii subsp. strangulata TaxID=200361 RepID=UPI003CC8DB08
MDHTETLPDDALAAILGRRRDLAACRRVRRAWLAVMDGRRLLPRRHHLPDSVEGIFANYCDYHRPHFLGRPSTRHRRVDYGNLHFLPGYTEDHNMIVGHCNGYNFYCGSMRAFCVVNPATRRWVRLPATFDQEFCAPYLAFDPTMSPHYKVFLIQPKDLGLFDVSSRWRYGVYCHGALHVPLYHGTFVTRFSLPSGKYKVIRTPIDVMEGKVGRHYLGRSEDDVYFAEIRDRIRIWTLSESTDQLSWVLKNIIDLTPLASISSLDPKGICRPWMLDDDQGAFELRIRNSMSQGNDA